MKKISNVFFFLGIIILCSCSTSHKKSREYVGHGGDSVTDEIVEKFSAGPISDDLKHEIEKMNEVRPIGMGHLSDNGKKMFFSWPVTGINQIWRLDGPNRFPIQMTGGEDQTTLEDVLHDNTAIILSRDYKGDEYPRIYSQSILGGPLSLLAGGDKLKTNYLGQDEKGLNIYYSVNDLGPTVFGIYKLNMRTLAKELLFKGEGLWWIADKRENGEMIIGHAIDNIAKEYFKFNEMAKKLTPLLGQKEKENYLLKFGRKKNEYLVLTNKFTDQNILYSYLNGQFKRISKTSSFDVENFSIDPLRKRILYLLNEGGHVNSYALDAVSKKEIDMPRGYEQAIHSYFGMSTPDAKFTILGKSFYNRPSTTYVYNWKTKKSVPWTFSSSPEIDTSSFSRFQLEYYPAEDGTLIPMFVKRPERCLRKSCPVIVQFHGGPEGQSIPNFDPKAELFTSRGYVYVWPNIRGSSGLGKAWLHADNGPKRLKVVSDIRDCARYIRKTWSYEGVVPKIGVTGGSYGGYATLLAMTKYAGEFDAGISVVGMSSLVSFLENTADYRRYLRESEYGELLKDREALLQLSPMTYIDQIKGPLLIIQGVSDPRVPVGEAIQMHSAIEKKNIPSKLILFSDEGHGIRKRKNRTMYIGHSLMFFEKHLRGID